MEHKVWVIMILLFVIAFISTITLSLIISIRLATRQINLKLDQIARYLKQHTWMTIITVSATTLLVSAIINYAIEHIIRRYFHSYLVTIWNSIFP